VNFRGRNLIGDWKKLKNEELSHEIYSYDGE
jgi:hypothetical protein